jgi:Methyltransferase domain
MKTSNENKENDDMIKTPPEMRAMTNELSSSVWTYATTGLLFESGLADHLREQHSVADLAARCPSLSTARIERCLALASAVGVVVEEGGRYRLADGATAFLQPPMRTSLQGDIRGTLLQALAFLDSATSPTLEQGWRHTNRVILQAQGDASAGLAPMLKMNLVPQMGDLAGRLERPGAQFLDVGVGVGALAIAMCRAFPQIRVVGVDSYDLPLSMAREAIARAGLDGRIDLVQSTIESLERDKAFDLAWLPTFFISEAVLPAAMARVYASLRPGGWVLYPTGSNPNANAQQNAVFGLVNHLWGGPVLSVERAESLLKEAGFESVRRLQGPVWAPAMLIGQRAA